MKKNNILLICITLLFFITGCNVNYNLNIEKDNVSEEITLTFKKSECPTNGMTCKEYVLEQSNYQIENENYPNYNIKYEEMDGNVIVTYTYDYDSYQDFVKNNIYKTAYKNVEVTKEKISLINAYTTLDNEINRNYNVKIKTDKKVINSNASFKDKKSGVYTWKFKDSDEKKNIIINFSELSNKKVDIISKTTLIVTLTISLMIMAVIIYILMKAKNNQKIK